MTETTDQDRALHRVIESTLDSSGITYEVSAPGRYLATLPGVKKQRTVCWLILDRRALLIEAFVCRRPDEAADDVHRYLLRRNARLYGVHYAIDPVGDIHLVGRVSRAAIGPGELDRILGQVLEAADGDFNTLLELGFAGAIRREWDWRVSRGESTANLQAFTHLVTRDPDAGPAIH